MCKYRSHKEDPSQTRITIGGNRICCPGDVCTPTGLLELVKLVINSFFSLRDAHFEDFDVSNFYLATPMDPPEFVRIRLNDIPKEFVAEYNLIPYANNGWIYFVIINRCYGLPQAGILANDLLCTRFNNSGNYETTTKPGIWCHKWHPIMFVLVVDDFVI